ncbi:MAG: FtsH protease activity modulator HflK [Deltaproteobacteria bacterium]|jgi:membrane protease subunit HflK|nr:FtsH protease activity modulator HflK [Deltaproteobacteria bacterium]
MNWDWDKLQEKRQRQSGQQPPKKDPERPEREDADSPIDFEAERRKRAGRDSGRDIWGRAVNRSRSGGGGSGGGGGGGLGGAWGRMRKNPFSFVKICIVLGVLVVIWLATGIFIVEPGEKGVVLRFGRHARTVESGPHYHLPYPIETVLTLDVRQVHRLEIGFSRVKTREGREERRSIPDEAAMLTGDENIVYVHFTVQYQIQEPEDFLFRSDMQLHNVAGGGIFSGTVKSAAESTMREVIGNSKIDDAIYGSKDVIQDKSRELLQNILNRYHTGVHIQNVQLMDVLPPPDVDAAFKDLINAREEKIRFINEAGAYRNDIIPKARGEAAETLNRAEAYKVANVQKAQGEASRFLSMVAEYNKAKDITKKRLYLEAMEEILSSPDLEKIIIGQDTGKNVLPYLPLDRTGKPAQSGGRAN